MTLGAYYKTEYNQPIGGLGAYYRNTENWRIAPAQDGLGQTPTPVSFAEHALEETLAAVSKGQLVAPWAERQGDVDWVDIPVPSESYLLYPLTDKLLATAKAASYGHEPNWCAILAPKPALISAVDAALTGRPYRLASTQGVYAETDTRPVPQPLVLYWLELRDDPHDLQGGQGSLEAAAKQLGGQLVFPMPTPRRGDERAQPDIDFQTAIGVARSPTAPVPVSPQTAAAAAGSGRWLWVVGAVGVGYLGWRWWKGRKG
jgi:hypothetical protein